MRYTDRTLASDDFVNDKEFVFVSNKNKQLHINSTKEFIDEVAIFNLTGQKIYQKGAINNRDFSLPNVLVSHQVVLVKIVLKNGQSVTKKVIH